MYKLKKQAVSRDAVGFVLWALLLWGNVASGQITAPPDVIARDPSEIPQFTIQIDAFSALSDAVEFGYSLPFDDNSLGLAKFRQGEAVRYILALGTFYSFGEAAVVLKEACPKASLDNCRVRYLGDLENIDADSAPPVAEVETVTALPDEPVSVDGRLVGTAEQAITNGLELSPPPAAKNDQASQGSLDIDATALDATLVYTVQVAALYDKSDALAVAANIPADMGLGEIQPLVGGRGNLMYGVTVGRFAYKDNAEVFANDVCAAVRGRGCWVKPLSLVERELAGVASLLGEPLVEVEGAKEVVVAPQPEIKIAIAPRQIDSATLERDTREELVYTVQIAAMYDEDDALGLARRVPPSYDAISVVPIRSGNGDIVYSVTVGRFAFKDDGQKVADDVCNLLNLSGCWVKPFALIEQARVEEW